MRINITNLFILLVTLLLFSFTTLVIEEISPKEFVILRIELKDKLQIIDARMSYEYDMEHIAYSLNIDFLSSDFGVRFYRTV